MTKDFRGLRLGAGLRSAAAIAVLTLGVVGCDDETSHTHKDACETSPCQHGGACFSAGENDFLCECPAGYAGDDCSSVIDPATTACTTNPCQNGGACYSMGDTAHLCACTGGYTGANCETAPTTPEIGYGAADGSLVIDLEKGNDRARSVFALPDDSLVFVGSGAPVDATDIDAMVVRVDARGRRIATFGTNGVVTQDLGSNDEALFTAAHDATSNTFFAGGYVGTQRVGGAAMDSLLYVLPLGGGTASFKTVKLSQDYADRIHALAVGSVGATKYVYAAGYVATAAGSTANTALALARFTLAGDLDTTFGPDATGVVTLDLAPGSTNLEQAKGVVVQADGKIVIAGEIESPTASNAQDTDIVLARFTTDGDLDTTFGVDADTSGTKDGYVKLSFGPGNGTVRDGLWNADVDSAGNIVLFGQRAQVSFTNGVAGTPSTNRNRVIARVLADGSDFDPTFNSTTNGTATLYGIYSLAIGGLSLDARQGAVQPNGDIISAGYVSYPTGVGSATANVIVLVRLGRASGAALSNGKVDTTFGDNGVVVSAPFAMPYPMAWGISEAYGAARLSDGSYVTAGYGRAAGETKTTVDLVSFKYKANGQRYTTSGL